jgi:hypothetical protein
MLGQIIPVGKRGMDRSRSLCLLFGRIESTWRQLQKKAPDSLKLLNAGMKSSPVRVDKVRNASTVIASRAKRPRLSCSWSLLVSVGARGV